MSNNDYGVNIGQVTSSRLCSICTNLRILSEISGVSRDKKNEDNISILGSQKSKKVTKILDSHQRNLYQFWKFPSDCLQMDARLQIKLKISEYYARFNKATIGSLIVPFRRRKVSFPTKKKKKRKKKKTEKKKTRKKLFLDWKKDYICGAISA